MPLQATRYKEILQYPGCIVLDLPENSQAACTVRKLRRRFDPERANIPVEITLTGSSGIGYLKQGQPLGPIAAAIDRLASANTPFQNAFAGKDCFPGTGIFFLTLKDEEPFCALQQQLSQERDLQFLSSPYPFRPHCTIRLINSYKAQETDPDLSDWNAVQVPHDSFLLQQISLYALMDRIHSQLLYRTVLSKNNSAGNSVL